MLDLSAFVADGKNMDRENLRIPLFTDNCSPTTMAAWRPLKLNGVIPS